MIKTRNLVPEYYYNQSRDFQLIGRIYEIVFNYVKTNIDLMGGLPLTKNSDLAMINLLLTTLGFSRRHDYNAEDLKRICSVFVELIRLKGTKKAVKLAIATLMSAQNISSAFDVKEGYDKVIDPDTGVITYVKNYSFDIYLPIALKDVVLLEDLFDFILPSGYVYRIYYSDYSDTQYLKLTLDTNDVKGYEYSNSNLTMVAKPQERDERPQSSNEDLGLTYTGVIYKPEDESQDESQEEDNNNE